MNCLKKKKKNLIKKKKLKEKMNIFARENMKIILHIDYSIFACTLIYFNTFNKE